MPLDPSKDPNFSFLHRLSPDNPIKISLSRRQEAQAPTVKKSIDKHGPPLAERRKKIRRPLPLGGIEFVDLGLLANGTTLPFNVKPTMTVNYNAGTNSVTIDFDDLTLAHHQSLYDMILDEVTDVEGVHLDQLKTAFTKIDGPEWGIVAYQGRGATNIDGANMSQVNKLDENNPEWKESKAQLKSLDNNILFVNYGGAVWHFDSNDSTKYKATTEYDYDASDFGVTNINFKKGTVILLVPQISFLTINQESGSGDDYRQAYLFGQWGLIPREIFLDRTLFKYLESPPNDIDVPYFEGYPGSYRSHDVDMLTLQYMSDDRVDTISDYIKTLPEAELYVQRGSNSVTRTFGFESLANFPFTFVGGVQDYINVTYSNGRESYSGWGLDNGDVYAGAGRLLAIVEQGSNFYYIWTKQAGWPNDGWAGEFMRTHPTI